MFDSMLGYVHYKDIHPQQDLAMASKKQKTKKNSVDENVKSVGGEMGEGDGDELREFVEVILVFIHI